MLFHFPIYEVLELLRSALPPLGTPLWPSWAVTTSWFDPSWLRDFWNSRTRKAMGAMGRWGLGMVGGWLGQHMGNTSCSNGAKHRLYMDDLDRKKRWTPIISEWLREWKKKMVDNGWLRSCTFTNMIYDFFWCNSHEVFVQMILSGSSHSLEFLDGKINELKGSKWI